MHDLFINHDVLLIKKIKDFLYYWKSAASIGGLSLVIKIRKVVANKIQVCFSLLAQTSIWFENLHSYFQTARFFVLFVFFVFFVFTLYVA